MSQHVIPREGVERPTTTNLPVKPDPHDPVIPREGVESEHLLFDAKVAELLARDPERGS